jgi:hypothetical protein
MLKQDSKDLRQSIFSKLEKIDEDVRNYIEGLLEDEDSFDDPETVRCTVESFLVRETDISEFNSCADRFCQIRASGSRIHLQTSRTTCIVEERSSCNSSSSSIRPISKEK